MISVIALLARAGHGKTTAANYLRDTYGAKIVSLATPLKRCAQKVMGFSHEQLWGTQAQKESIDPRYGISARRFLQLLGTEGLRGEFGPDVHVRALLHAIEQDDLQNPGHGVYVVDDVRFPNEVSAIVESEDHRGVCIKLVCTDAPPTPGGDHASEAGIDLVPEELIATTLISSRSEGVEDLRQKLEQSLRVVPRLFPVARALDALKMSEAA